MLRTYPKVRFAWAQIKLMLRIGADIRSLLAQSPAPLLRTRRISAFRRYLSGCAGDFGGRRC
jgi:hypothetical protein